MTPLERVTGGVWIDLHKDGSNVVWQVKWTANIILQMLSFANLGGSITKLYLKLGAIVPQESVFHSIIDSLEWQTPKSGSNNTTTVASTFRKSSTINPVVDILISIHSAHIRMDMLTLSV